MDLDYLVSPCARSAIMFEEYQPGGSEQLFAKFHANTSVDRADYAVAKGYFYLTLINDILDTVALIAHLFRDRLDYSG